VAHPWSVGGDETALVRAYMLRPSRFETMTQMTQRTMVVTIPVPRDLPVIAEKPKPITTACQMANSSMRPSNLCVVFRMSKFGIRRPPG